MPEALVSDHGGVFRSYDAIRIYEALGIQKVEIEKRQAWQSYIESNFNAQRRLADWHFENAHSWEDLLAAHEKWLLDFNYQHHFAHEQREDGCHSPAAVLGWVKGMQPEPERIYRAFSRQLTAVPSSLPERTTRALANWLSGMVSDPTRRILRAAPTSQEETSDLSSGSIARRWRWNARVVCEKPRHA